MPSLSGLGAIQSLVQVENTGESTPPASLEMCSPVQTPAQAVLLLWHSVVILHLNRIPRPVSPFYHEGEKKIIHHEMPSGLLHTRSSSACLEIC